MSINNLITLKEVRARYGFSRSFWYKKTTEKRIRYYKMGNTLLFNPTDIEKFLNDRIYCVDPV